MSTEPEEGQPDYTAGLPPEYVALFPKDYFVPRRVGSDPYILPSLGPRPLSSRHRSRDYHSHCLICLAAKLWSYVIRKRRHSHDVRGNA